MSLFYYLTWFTYLLFVCAGSFALAVSLYFLAELVEENTKTSSKVIRGLILMSSAFYVLLIPLENFPWILVVCGLIAQLCHYMLMRTFPAIELKSVWFFGTIGLFILNHFLAFRHFSSQYYPFTEVIAYFVLFLWIVPMSLIISLSANDLALPNYVESTPLVRSRDLLPSQFPQRRKGYSLKNFLTYIKEQYLPMIGIGAKKSF